MIVVAIDGKLTGSGFAIGTTEGSLIEASIAHVPRKMHRFEDRILRQVTHIRNALEAHHIDHVDLVIAELPRVYPGGRNRADPNDLVELAGCTLAIAGALRPRALKAPTARAWKGTIPKSIHHERLAARYPHAVPLVNQTTPFRRNDVWDAIGLYYWGIES